MLGDWRDIDFDQQNRPTRPLPRGIITPSLVKTSAWFLIFAAFALACCPGLILEILQPSRSASSLLSLYSECPQYLKYVFQLDRIATLSVLTLCIVTYAFFHKQNRTLALTLMSSCRFWLIMFAFVAAQDFHTFPTWSGDHDPILFFYQWFQPWMIIMASCIGLYTFSLSSVAATESNDHPFSYRKLLFLGMLSLPLIAVYALKTVASFPHHGLLLLGASLIIYLAWLIHSFSVLPQSKPAFVSKALAGFCLLDACIASTFSLPITLLCLGLFGLALLLQKVTPAT